MRLIMLTFLIAFVSGLALAELPEKSPREKSGAVKSVTDRKQAMMAKSPVTPAREKLAIRFAKANHTELAGLLQSLKAMDRTHYLTAIWEVARDAERLGRLRERNDDRYESSLKIWKLDSRIRIEAARFSMEQTESTEQKLRQLMLARREARLEFLRMDRKRSQARTDRIDEQIATLASDPEKAVTTEIDRLRRSLAARAGKRAESVPPRLRKSQPTIRNTSARRATPAGKEASATKSRSRNTP